MDLENVFTISHSSYLSEIKASCLIGGPRVSGENYKVKHIKLRNS